jgi:hypothetical protein
MKIKNIKSLDFLSIAIAVFYSFGLIYFIPIDSVMDRDNYLTMGELGWSQRTLLYYFTEGIFNFFTNEPLWLIINSILSFVFNSSEEVVKIIIVFSSFVSAILLLKNNRKHIWYIIFLLLLPTVMKNYVIHLRQGLAITFFLIGFYSNRRLYKNIFLGITPLIHSSFFIVLILFLMLSHLKNKQTSLIIQITCVVIVSLLIAVGSLSFASLLGARQGTDYQDLQIMKSGVAFIFWFFIFILFAKEGRIFITNNMFAFSSVILYLITYFFSPITARIFESSIIFVLLSGFYLKHFRQKIFLLLLFLNFIYFITINLNKPFLGYGIQ